MKRLGKLERQIQNRKNEIKNLSKNERQKGLKKGGKNLKLSPKYITKEGLNKRMVIFFKFFINLSSMLSFLLTPSFKMVFCKRA